MRGTHEPIEILSFRHLLTGAVEDFLAAEEMTGGHAAEVIGELIVSLSRYREEGTALYPLVFLCDSLEPMLRHLEGHDPIVLGRGPEGAETARRALKACAQLGGHGWSMFLERAGGDLRFGVFRTNDFVLCETPFEVLRRTTDCRLRTLGVVQLADSIVELRGSGGTVRYVHLSGARTDGPLPKIAARDLMAAVTRDVPAQHRADVATFYRRVMLDVLRAPHGTLVAVLGPGADPHAVFRDGLTLASPVDLVGLIDAYRLDPTEATRAAVQGASALVQGMMASDGITVLRSDGRVLGFNVFVGHHAELEGMPRAIGGARRRTFETLAERVGGEIVAAFYRSQDGQAACRAG